MKLFDDIKMSKTIDNTKLCVAKCTNGNIMLYIGNSKGKIFLKRFVSYRAYERFITRSVILYLLSDGSKNKDVDRVYISLESTIGDLYNEKNSLF